MPEDGAFDQLNEHLYSESMSKTKSYASSHYTLRTDKSKSSKSIDKKTS